MTPPMTKPESDAMKGLGPTSPLPGQPAPRRAEAEAAAPVTHTAGPWSSHPSGKHMREDYTQPYGVLRFESATLVCGCFGDVPGGEREAEANARLIAAAPDLLSALTALKDASIYLSASGATKAPVVHRLADEKFKAALKLTYAAISKATAQGDA